MSVIMMLGMLGISVDLMRDFETYHQLEFAAQAAALYGLSLATNIDGSYSLTSAQTNIAAAVAAAGAASWNSAQFGPDNSTWSKPVTFASSDIQFVKNPKDGNEFFLQVTARREAGNALKQFFVPVLHTALPASAVPAGVKTFSTQTVVEVLGQPASRIGAGPPLNSSGGTRASDLIEFATLPLAISNAQFATIANPSQQGTTYTIDLVSSTSSEYRGSAPAGHVKGCLVNVASTGGGSIYYGNAQGNLAIEQLEGLFNYFGAKALQQTIAPALVERGSRLSAFDPADPVFLSRRSEISQALIQLPHKFYIIPVLAVDPNFSSTNIVVGFARLKLNQVNVQGNVPTSVAVDIAETVPVRNASSATGFSGIPMNLSTLMPAPVYPFIPRQFDPGSNGVSARPRGVVLAPAISPRQINAT
jgi:hypothetical protein